MSVADFKEYEEKIKGPYRQAASGGAGGALPVLMFDEIEPRLSDHALIEDLLGSTAMSVLYGDSNTGKTFLGLDAGLHVSWGRTWFGREVERGGVLFVAGEGGFRIENRVSAFKKHYGIANLPFAVVPCAIDLRSDAADTDRLIATITATAERMSCPLRLLEIDTLSRALAGGNESSSEDMGAYVQNIDKIRQATGAHVLSVHHTGKDQARGARGHSLLRAATDTEIEVTRDEVTKLSVVRVTKQRDLAIDGKEFAFRLQPVDLGISDRGKPVTSCVVAPEDSPAQLSAKRKPLTGPAKLAMEQLLNCVIEMGVHVPASDNVAEGLRGVTLAQWKERLGKAGVINMESGHREQFRRIRVTLGNAGRIGVWEDFVWSVT